MNETDDKITLVCGKVEETPPEERRQRRYRCRFVRSGTARAAGNQPGRLEIEAGALEAACREGLFEGRAVFVDHAGPGSYPSLKDLAGVTGSAHFNRAEGCVEGSIRLYDTPLAANTGALLDALLEDGAPSPDVGLSMVFWPVYAQEVENSTLVVQGIRHVESVDLVFEPAADGRVLSRLRTEDGRPGEGPETEDGGRGKEEGRRTEDRGRVKGSGAVQNKSMRKGDEHMTEKIEERPAETERMGAAQPESGAAETQAQGWLDALGRSAGAAMIAASGLPRASCERLAARSFRTPQEVEQAVEAERAYLAALQEDRVVSLEGGAPRGASCNARVSGMRSSLDQLSSALDALLAGRRPADAQPLSGIRELYHLLSGDYEMTGLFHAERVSLANVNSTTMAGLVANALNKRVVNEFQQYPQWWTPVVQRGGLQHPAGGEVDHPGRRRRAAHRGRRRRLHRADLGRPDRDGQPSSRRAATWGITLEAIDKDDTGRLRAAHAPWRRPPG